MNWINRKIAFLINKNDSFVYGISSHGLADIKPILIYNNGDEYFFKGEAQSQEFQLVVNSISAVDNKSIKKIRSVKEIENDVITALQRYGFQNVTFKKDI
jgi:hypothetical protein